MFRAIPATSWVPRATFRRARKLLGSDETVLLGPEISQKQIAAIMAPIKHGVRSWQASSTQFTARFSGSSLPGMRRIAGRLMALT
jgi:hypothetical protein